MTHELKMDGPAMSRREPEIDTRGGRVRVYSHPDTKAGLAAWKMVWMTQGRPHAGGAFWLQVTIECRRPRAHFLQDGRTLSAAGKRSPRPTVKPDCSNVVKLIEDALKGLAFGDDKDCVWLQAEKVWSSRDRVTVHFDRWVGSSRELSRVESEGDPSLAA